MKENTIYAEHLLSKRALEILGNPKHLESSSANLDKKNQWNWNLTLDKTDKILTLSYSNQSPHPFESLFLETLSRLSIGKNLHQLIPISFREVENFLRDENHLPAFVDSDEKELEICYKKVKNSLLGELLFRKLKDNKDIFPQNNFWNELSFVEKNRRILALLFELQKAFPKGKKLDLALVEGESISLIKNDFPLDLEVVENVLQAFFHGSHGKTCLKVVAVF